MKNSNIEWCDHTFNPWEGCTKVSPGCANCYAENRNARFGGGTAVNWGKGAPRRRTSVQNWNHPVKWNEEAAWEDSLRIVGAPRPRVFCASLADWLDDEVPIEWLADLLDLIRRTPHLDWLLLTKRPENWSTRISAATDNLIDRGIENHWVFDWFVLHKTPANVWIGTTVEDQARAYERIPALLDIPARVRFLSCEPLLGPVKIATNYWLTGQGRRQDKSLAPVGTYPRIDWVICGGESGPKARPMHPEWARGLRDQCAHAGVPFLFKQWGEWLPGSHVENAPDHDPQCITKIAMDGTVASSTHMPFEKRDGMKTICLVGKKIAGSLLDGIEHNGFPGGAK